MKKKKKKIKKTYSGDLELVAGGVKDKKSDKKDFDSKKIIDLWKELYSINHESFTPVQILEQITIVAGFLLFMVGSWIVLYKIIQALIR